MKVDLVLPRQEKGIKATIVSQALAQLAAVTPENVQLRCIDEFFEASAPSLGVDLVGISVRTPQYKRALEISQTYKNQGAKVVWGGIHPTVLPLEKSELVDCYVRGEAERTWPMLLGDFERGELKGEYADKVPVDINAIPLPRRDISRPKGDFIIEALISARGCRYNCEYCPSRLLYAGKGIRFADLRRVAEDLKNIPGKVVALCDENLMNDEERAEALLDVFAESGKQFLVQFDPHSARNSELVKKLSGAGVIAASIGFESVNPENFRGNGKYVHPSEWPRIVERMHKNGILVNGLFMFGLDQDDERVFDETKRIAAESGIDHVSPGILTPFPGTRLYQRLEEEGRILHRRWGEYDAKHVVFRPKNISPEELQAKWNERYAPSLQA